MPLPISGIDPDAESTLNEVTSGAQSMPAGKKTVIYSLLSLLFLVITGGLGWLGLSYFRGRDNNSFLVGYSGMLGQLRSIIRPEDRIPSPINGILYDPQEAEEWEKRRPLAVMINNHEVARSVQTGVSQADLVYEAVAEGGISRLLAIFHSRLPEKIGSIRSARVYFVDWAKEYDAWYAHHGRAQIDPNNPLVCSPEADAFTHMQRVFVSSIEGVSSCWRESNGLAYEHTLFCDPRGLLDEAYALYPDQPRDFREDKIEPWLFKEDDPVASASAVSTISFNFWDTVGYKVDWKYKLDTNSYLRWQAGLEHRDAATGEQLEAKTVIVQFMRETPLNDLKLHLLYNTVGEGRARIFMDGRVIKAKWSRPEITSRTQYVDDEGEAVEFNRGQIWIEVVPTGTEVTYI